MDPQKLASLNPKLREAYQRVMGTPMPQPQTPPSQTQTPPPTGGPTPAPTPMPIPEPESISPKTTPSIQEVSVPQPQPFIPQSESISEPPSAIPQPQPFTPEPAISPEPPVQADNFVQMNSEVQATPSQNFISPSAIPQSQAITLKKKNGMMLPILFGIVGLVFLAVYTLFWTKIFNFKLPFLP